MEPNCKPPHYSESPTRFHSALAFDIWLISGLFFPIPLVAVGENPKESKPQAGTTRQQDMNRRDQQRNQGTSTTSARPNPGGVQDTEMVRLRRAGNRRGGESWRFPSETAPLGLAKSSIPVPGAWLVGPAGSAAELSLPPGPLPQTSGLSAAATPDRDLPRGSHPLRA